MLRFVKCAVVVSRTAGNGRGRHLFETILAHRLKKAGVTYKIVEVPRENWRTERTPHEEVGSTEVGDWVSALKEPTTDALIVCGGDGSLLHVARGIHRQWERHMISERGKEKEETAAGGRESVPQPNPPPTPCWEKPIVLFPIGVHNTVAFHWCIRHPAQTISSFIAARTEAVCVWQLQRRLPVTGTAPASTMTVKGCCLTAVVLGCLVEEQQRYQRFRSEWNQVVALPAIASGAPKTPLASGDAFDLFRKESGGSLRGTRWLHWMSLWCTLWRPSRFAVPATLFLHFKEKDFPSHFEPSWAEEAAAEKPGERALRVHGPFALVMLSAFPSIGSDMWLTPTANPRSQQLTVTVAGRTSTRLRLWHLLRREARVGEVESTDGVCSFDRVCRVAVHIDPLTASEEGEAAPKDKIPALVDGELVLFQRGETIACSPTAHHLPVCIC